ncbi:MAG: aminotransferase class I/II-fold pyridoxal phosphate-dependent enzyme, partial [Candidatus Omnitrophica bacterium]|nr:aminotransferase class I/II-fold pyridoxal phosphate-dependent enzyme [Candidatus Omnitrophota bacterium]
MHAIPRRCLHLSGEILKKSASYVFLGKDFNGACREFEKQLAAYLGVFRAYGVSSARKGLAVVLSALKIKPGDEIIVSDLNYYAVPAVIQALGMKAVFVDIDPETGNMDLDGLMKSITPRTRVIIVTHLFGRVCDMNSIVDIARTHNLFLIEDCAQALGAEWGGRKAGSFGDAALFSFGIGKDLMCFGGGMITAVNPALAPLIEEKIIQARPAGRAAIIKEIHKHVIAAFFSKRIVFRIFVLPFLKLFYLCRNVNLLDILFGEEPQPAQKGFLLAQDSRLSDFQAAVGLEQLSLIDERNRKRIVNSKIIDEELKGLSINFGPSVDNNTYFAYKILSSDRDNLRRKLLFRGVDTQ